MKKYVLILILTVLSLPVFSQEYQPFPTQNAMWREYEYHIMSHWSHYQYVITGDTVMNDLTYHKLQKSGSYYEWFNSSISGINEYVGAFREDIENKKVYFMQAGKVKDTLLYDFDLNIGDTLPPLYGYAYNYDNIVPIVLDIDSVLLSDGVYHKRFLIKNCPQMWIPLSIYFIEGVGSSFGLLTGITCPFENRFELVCLTVDSQSVYILENSGKPCALAPIIESIDRIEQREEINFKVFPNPASGFVCIDFDKQKPLPDYIEIANMIGEITLREMVRTHSVDINVSNFPPGTYVIRISKNGRTIGYKKLVISK